MPAKLSHLLSVATVAATLAAGAAQAAPTVAELAVSPARPTQIAIRLAGKSPTDVRQEVRVMARTVCRNAALNDELDSGDVRWCRFKTTAKALRRYDAILAGGQQQAALPATIVLSSR